MLVVAIFYFGTSPAHSLALPQCMLAVTFVKLSVCVLVTVSIVHVVEKPLAMHVVCVLPSVVKSHLFQEYLLMSLESKTQKMTLLVSVGMKMTLVSELTSCNTYYTVIAQFQDILF